MQRIRTLYSSVEPDNIGFISDISTCSAVRHYMISMISKQQLL